MQWVGGIPCCTLTLKACDKDFLADNAVGKAVWCEFRGKL